MIFTRISYFAAVVSAFTGLIEAAMGFTLAGGDIEQAAATLRRYTTHATTGEAIDAGFYKIMFALLVGTLAEISYALRRK